MLLSFFVFFFYIENNLVTIVEPNHDLSFDNVSRCWVLNPLFVYVVNLETPVIFFNCFLAQIFEVFSQMQKSTFSIYIAWNKTFLFLFNLSSTSAQGLFFFFSFYLWWV